MTCVKQLRSPLHIFNAAKNKFDIFQFNNFIRMTWIAKTHRVSQPGPSQIWPEEGFFVQILVKKIEVWDNRQL